MEIPQLQQDQGEVLREHSGYQIRLLILGPDQMPSLETSFVAVLFAVVPKYKMIVMLQVHRADSYSVARAWGLREGRTSYRRQIDEVVLKARKEALG
jgi:hypothetical protein